MTREWLEVTESTSVAYELLRRKEVGDTREGYPSPMPLATLDESQKAQAREVLRWFEKRL